MRFLAFLALLGALTLSIYSYAVNYPTASTSTPASVAPSLPGCESEDGAGMALCYWDADTMGNGYGTDVISGDCAPDYVGGQAVSDLCVRLYGERAYDYEYQGASIHVPNGEALVQECTQEWNMMDDETAKAEGFTLEECFKGMLGM